MYTTLPSTFQPSTNARRRRLHPRPVSANILRKDEGGHVSEQERTTAYFSGQVQGVGFRFTALDISERFPDVTGYVRNLPDRRVEVVAEGRAAEVDAFIGEIAREMRAYIRGVERERASATGEFSGFRIER